MGLQCQRLCRTIALVFIASQTAWAAPDTTLSISPDATAGTTITASDENSRSSSTETWANAHSHLDISAMTGVNTFTIGDNTAGNKSYAVDNEFTTAPSIRYSNVTESWDVIPDGADPSLRVEDQVIIVGDGSENNQSIAVDTSFTSEPSVRYNLTGEQWEFSNDASTFSAFGGRAFVGSFTRDTSTASGTQSVTGVGFQPNAVVFFAAQDASREMSVGFDNGTTGASIADDADSAGTYQFSNNQAIRDEETSGSTDVYSGVISSLDTDGFTITWTRTGAPTGTLTVEYLAIQ